MRYKKKLILERFENKLEKTDGCWDWPRGRNEYGYGLIKINGIVRRAHRVSWELYEGPIPDGLCVLHRCDNRPCVNPKHLFLGTNADNVEDMVAKGRNRYPGSLGEKNGNCKLSDQAVAEIRENYAKGGVTYRELGRLFNVSHWHVGQIVNRRIRINNLH